MKLRIPIFTLIAFTAMSLGCASGGGGGGDDSPAADTGGSSAETSSASIGAFCATSDPDDHTLAGLSAGFSEFLASTAFQRSTQSSLSREPALIPVYFHVISKGSTLEDGEATDQSIAAQIDVLNRAFSAGTGTPFRFGLAGIDRVQKPEWHVMNPGSQSELDAKKALHKGGPETLNIYLVTTEGGILGYTTLPVLVGILSDYDGIVMNFRTLPGGSLERYNTGNVAVHETGHWLGLLHTFSEDCGAIFGDLVQDTPVELIPTKGEFCPVNRDSCPDAEGADPVHNHMTYTVDSCRTEFTPGQVQFMQFNSFAFRGLNVL